MNMVKEKLCCKCGTSMMLIHPSSMESYNRVWWCPQCKTMTQDIDKEWRDRYGAVLTIGFYVIAVIALILWLL